MTLRMFAAASVAAAAGLLASGGPAMASADTGTSAASGAKSVAITGVTAKGQRVHATYLIKRLVRGADGRVYAVTEVRARLAGRTVVRRNVRVAVTPRARTAQIEPTPGACQVLSLTLGPLDLNLLGLRVRLNRVDLLIEAIPGGGLLGDLLCGLSGGPTGTATAALAGTFTLQRFSARAGRLYAVGRLGGRTSGRTVAIPIARVAQVPPTPAACQVLNLTLGPLDLNLLGLRVRTSRIDLRIEAIPGGGLLGDLLCGLSGGPTTTTASPTTLARTLNQLLQLRPAAARQR